MTRYSDKDIQHDRDMLLEKMIDPDATLTDADLEMILRDDELRDIYDVSALVRGACVQPSEIDVRREWRMFRRKLYARPSRWRWVMRVAAIFLGVLLVSGIARIAVDTLLTDSQTVMVAESPTGKEPASRPGPASSAGHSAPSITVEEGAAPEPVAVVPESVPKKAVVVESEDEDTQEIDIDEYLRLQQARIESDLALLQARIYIDQLQAIDGATLPSDGEESEPQEVRYIIMQ